MNNPRYRLDPRAADIDNPRGIVMNIGEWIPVGNVLDVLDQLGTPAHELLRQYEDFEAPQFIDGDWCSEGLWAFPGWFILARTFHHEIIPFARELGVDEVPYTILRAISRNGLLPDDLRELLAR